MSSGKRVAIIGAGGQAKVIADSLLSVDANVDILVFDELADSSITTCCDRYPLITDKEAFKEALSSSSVIVAIGDNQTRLDLFKWCQEHDAQFETVIHHSAVVSESVTIGLGSCIFALAAVNPYSQVGSNCIINTGAIVEHDCIVGDHSHIAPNVTLCGGVSIGEGCLLGASSTVLPGVKIGRNVTIGAGAVVAEDIADNARVAGVPARQI